MLSLVIMGVGKALFVILTANFYGPEGQGIVTLAISVMVAAALLLGLGTDLAGTYLVGRDPGRVKALRANSVWLSLVALIAALGVVHVAVLFFGDTVFKDFPDAGYPALVAMVVLQIFHLQIQGLTVGLGRFLDLVAANLLQYLLLVVGVVALSFGRQPVVGVLYLWAAGLVVKTVYLLARMPTPGTECSEGRLQLLRAQLSKGTQMMAGNLANLLNFRLDAYFIAFFLPASQLGLYAVAATIAEAILYLPKALGQVVFSWSSQDGRESRDSAERIRNVFVTAAYSTLLFALLVQVVLRPVLTLLFQEPFLAALAPARILLFGSVAYGIGLVAMNLIYGFGNPAWNTRAGVIAVILNAVGNVFVIPHWGILGAACTSLASYSVYCILNLSNVGRYLPAGQTVRSLLVADRRYLATSLDTLRRTWAMFRRV